MSQIKLGVIGVGGMGQNHCASADSLDNVKLAAICDANKEKADEVAEKFGAKAFYDAQEMYKSGEIDSVLIAVPHYAHTPLTIQAFEAGINVLVEKPIAVHKADALKMIEAHEKHADLKFAAMFQMRTNSLYKKLKQLLEDDEMGNITRVNWIVTNWFRTQAYYDSGSWRATWKGEGGGVLLNQCPHQLDLFQWLFGVPTKIRAFCGIGKYHNIEVDDTVTAYCEYENGATGVFVTSTAEFPGTNRLEIVGDRGRMVVEDGKITFNRTEKGVKEFSDTTSQKFASIPTWNVDVPYADDAGSHKAIIENFAEAILDGKDLIAPAEEGIKSVEIANTMLFSSMNDTSVDMPLDAAQYETLLKKLIDESTFEKKVNTQAATTDFTKSFNK